MTKQLLVPEDVRAAVESALFVCVGEFMLMELDYPEESVDMASRIDSAGFINHLAQIGALRLAPVQADQEVDAEVEACWTDFWLPLVAPDGVVDLAQIKRELFDYHTFMRNAAEVYCHVTDGRISKINTDASAVIGVADECLNRRIEEALEEANFYIWENDHE